MSKGFQASYSARTPTSDVTSSSEAAISPVSSAKSSRFKDALTLAIEALSLVELNDLSARAALRGATQQLGIGDYEIQRAAHRLVFETLKRLNFIDFMIKNALDPEAFETLPLGVKAFLRIYAYEVVMRGRGPRGALGYVRAARGILGWRTLNPVEETFARLLGMKPEALILASKEPERTALRTFHPPWFVEYCVRAFGRVEALRLLEPKGAPFTFLRLNTLRDSEPRIIEALEKEGIRLRVFEGIRHLYVLTGETRLPLTRMKAYREGLFEEQDLLSAYAVEASGVKKGFKVLEIGARRRNPGAMASHMAQLMENEGLIVSLRDSGREARIWKLTIARMGVRNAELILADANACAGAGTKEFIPLDLKADLVFLEPPSTETGAFHHDPSLKWKTEPGDIQRLARLQANLLESVLDYVRPGGSLVYLTSSLTIEENEMQIERLLRLHSEFEAVPLEPSLGQSALRGLKNCRRFFLHRHGCGSGFIAKLRRL
ncbi:MAG: RsmB/NOP family class I SAM-dependent RNA methyltransferase [Candidatus Bathyarchaeia archaeon]